MAALDFPGSPTNGQTYTANGVTFVFDGTAWAPNASAVALTSATASLSADVQLPISGTFYDGPGVSLTAGTWLVVADVTFVRTATTATNWIARISDGTTHYASGQTYTASLANIATSMALTAIVTLTSTTTIKLQATTSAGATACLMKAATPNSGSGNNATSIVAVRIG
jgi:hypothetical protein